MDIILYFCANTRAVRPRWLLEELQLDYQLKIIDIYSGQGQDDEYKAIHPNGQVPAIALDGEILYESAAICSVLTDKFPHKKLAPACNSNAQLLYQQWMYYAVTTVEPHVFHFLLHSQIYPLKKRIPEIAKWNLIQYQAILKVLENIFRRDMLHKKYLINDQFSTADIMLASILFWTPNIVMNYPSLHQYASHLKQRNAYKRALL